MWPVSGCVVVVGGVRYARPAGFTSMPWFSRVGRGLCAWGRDLLCVLWMRMCHSVSVRLVRPWVCACLCSHASGDSSEGR